MQRYAVRFTKDAEDDLTRLYDFLLEKDIRVAERALVAIRRGIALLHYTPYSCRKSANETPRHREIHIPFGASGYVALFEIEPPATLTILAIRHQREDDYH